MRFRYAIITHTQRQMEKRYISIQGPGYQQNWGHVCQIATSICHSPPKVLCLVWASSLTVVLHFRKLCGGCFYGPRCDPRAALVAIIVASWHSSLYSSFYITLSALTHYRFEPVKVSSINQISQHRTSLAGQTRCSCAGWTCPFGGFNFECVRQSNCYWT